MVKSKETKFISPIKTDKSKYILPIIVIALAAVLPMVIKDQYIIRVLNMAMLYSIIALSVNLIVGISGQLDFGRSAFVGLGAYWSALTMMKLNFPFIVAFLTAGLFCALMGFLLGMICRNSEFDYLTVLTIGFNEICRLIFLNWTDFTGGAMGIKKVPDPSFFGFAIDTNTKYFYFSLILLFITYVMIKRIIKSKWGRAFEALRDNPIAASYSGINVSVYKVLCFTIASFFSGVAGSAMVHFTNYASPFNYTLDESIILLQMAILGGLGSLPGSILGACILTILPELSRTFYDYRLMFMGFLMVILMIWAPNGILGKNGIGDKVIGLSRFVKEKKSGGEIE